MATTECPICSRHVRAENLMLHVDACLAKQDQPKTQFRSPSPSAKTKSPTTSRTPNRSPPPQNSPSSSALKKRKRSTTDDVSAVPLAERMRPKDLDDLVGQEELLGPGSLLSGATSKAGDMKDAVDRARGERKMFRRRTIVFVDEIHRFNKMSIEAEDEAVKYLATQCAGDARAALNCLEMALQTAPMDTEKQVLRVSATHVKHCFAHRQTLFYDRNADMHYDVISALHKSIRGSDENATLYWLARMLEGGENPLYVARRLIRVASEDVGLAAPELLPMAVSAYQAAHFVGMPECDVVLAHVATMLARAPKSIEVYAAYKRAKQSIHEWNKGALPDVPLHIRNAPTKLMKELGYAKGYKYNPHYTAEELKDQTYLPDELLGTNFFEEAKTNRDAEC
ncbi:hypothetical protein AM588_10007727 [Phytophthora nicotianae]|uniref:ATPase WRNIP1 n=1 Tax=Phytophthora nicotianae TaxID=4792 RepID=A0A0W8CNR4_PHYNI|nr:hypothetical protein AM588_10007727 [Phytophthora nicotianae]